MTLSFINLFLSRRPLLLYAASWTAILTATVAVASFTPEFAFVWATSPVRACREGYVKVPMDMQPVCLPVKMFTRSKADFLVPPLFAAMVVAVAACFVGAMEFEGSAMTDDRDF